VVEKKAIIIRRKRGNGYFWTIEVTPTIPNGVPKKVIRTQSQVLSNLIVFSRLGNIDNIV